MEDFMVELEKSFEEDLKDAAEYHGHICVGQIIGVRLARLGCATLGIAQPRSCRDLVTFVEIDRCLSDAVGTVTGCKGGKRRLKYKDYGKSAATFVNIATGEAVRVSSIGWCNVPKDADPNEYLGKIKDEELFKVERVSVKIKPEDLPGPPVSKVQCSSCGEFVTDRRELVKDGKTLCKTCADGGYYEIHA
jgi:formylmethanofuran dehydrogenase subunit E